MNMHPSLLAASLVTLGLLGHPAWSQADPGDRPSMQGRHCHHHCPPPGDAEGMPGLERMADHLNLSKEQRQAMHAIEDKYRPEMRDLRQLLADNRAALMKMDAGDAKLQETAEAQGKTLADTMILRKKMHAELDKVLTEEQRQTLGKLMTRQPRGNMHHEWRGGE